jgi:two-component system sensor histidine kinase BaeS
VRSLRVRLFLSILLPLLVIVPTVALALNYLLQTQVLVAGIANELIRQAVLVAEASSTSVEIWRDPGQAQAFVGRLSPRLSAKLMLFDPAGRLMVSSDAGDANFVGQVYAMPDLQSLLAQDQNVEVRYNHSQISDVIVPVVTHTGQLIGFVWLTNPLAAVYARSQLLRQITFYVAIFGILSGILLGWLLARDLERPLKNTSQAVYKLVSGQQPLEPLLEQGPSEIRVLVRAFNTLVERLKSSEEARRRQLANTVHELGRPLGALLSATQALNSGALKQPGLRNELLQGMEREVVTLQHLLDDLARLDQGSQSLQLRLERVALAEWLPPLLAPWGEAAQKKRLTWRQSLETDLPDVEIDPQRLAQALGNLISNAIRYTPSGGEVTVEVGARKDGDASPLLAFCVRDSGQGIAPEEQALIFQPFFRGKDVRHVSDGMGLGLTIARDIAVAHGGQLNVESATEQGSTFTLSLPLKES